MTAEDTQEWFQRCEQALEAGLAAQRDREDWDIAKEAPAWAEPLKAYATYQGPGGHERLLGYLEREDPVWTSAALLALRNLGSAPFETARARYEALEDGSPMRGALGLVLAMSWGPADALTLEQAWGEDVLARAMHQWLLGLMPEDASLWPAVYHRMQAFGAQGEVWLEQLGEKVRGELEAESGVMMAWEFVGGAQKASEQISAAYMSRREDEEAYWFLKRALESLERLGQEQTGEAALFALDSDLHEIAARVLGRLGDAGVALAHPRVLAWCGDEVRRERRSSAVRVALGHVSESSSQALWSLVEDTDRHVRHTVWYALAARGHEGVLEAMVSKLDDEDVLEVEEARAVLASHPDARARAALEAALVRAQEAGDEDGVEDLRYLLGV